jgi:hypothetical protein
MNDKVKRKSPRHPSWNLEIAIKQAIEVYNKEKRNFAPMDIVAKHLGYSGINNGAALTAFSTLAQFGLLVRTPDGRGSTPAELEKFLFAPSQEIKNEILLIWAKNPQIFQKIIEKYPDNLPSEATLIYELIEWGFSPKAAKICADSFIETVDFISYYQTNTRFC